MMGDADIMKRNLNPTPAAKVAMIIWGKKYSEQRGGSMEFFNALSEDMRNRCELVVTELQKIEHDKS